ncbi:MAG TPA: hypothetical protein VFH61_07825 [Thermoleophilia bacterium]|nr:hypothetical protein [Thermoleophilia bacterium]
MKDQTNNIIRGEVAEEVEQLQQRLDVALADNAAWKQAGANLVIAFASSDEMNRDYAVRTLCTMSAEGSHGSTLLERLAQAEADNAAMIRRFRDWRHRAYSDEDGVFIDDVEAEMRELQAQEHPGDKLLDERHKLKALEWAARQALGDEWVDNMLEAAAGKQPVGAPTDSPIPARRDESTD